ncbi:MAG: holo-ACP synthase [Opitutales bacterium]
MNLEGGNVVGVGVDLAEIARIREAHRRHGDAFLDKVFTKEEQALCFAKPDPYPSLAARFAAKEAVSKALGTGFGEELSLRGVSVLADEAGAPVPRLDAAAGALLARRGATRVLVSLTHTDELAQAFAVLVR